MQIIKIFKKKYKNTCVYQLFVVTLQRKKAFTKYFYKYEEIFCNGRNGSCKHCLR